MKKLAVVMVILVVFAGAALVAGCGGGDTKQAQQYMKAGDDLYEQLATDSNELASKVTTAFADVTDPAKLQGAVDELNKFLDGMDAKADKATAEYDKIKPLQGVPDYVRYADMQTELMVLIKKATAQLKSVMNEVALAATAGDTAKLQSIQSTFEPDFTKLSEEISKLEEESSKFKSDKNL